MAQILVIEDDRRVADLLARGLTQFGYTTHVAYDGESGVRLFNSVSPDLVISDIILPGTDGFGVVKAIKSSACPVPVIMLTALGATDDKLEGFDAGADDYMVKPFDLRELDARIRNLIKREGIRQPVQSGNLEFEDLTADLNTKTVYRQGRIIKLTPKEFNLLIFMMKNRGRVVTREEIAREVWSTHFDTGTNFIDVYINYLRKKIDREFSTKLIHTRQGMGFILCREDENKV